MLYSWMPTLLWMSLVVFTIITMEQIKNGSVFTKIVLWVLILVSAMMLASGITLRLVGNCARLNA
jgi:hypothetical protein